MRDELSAKFAALGHPVRREILRQLAEGSRTVGVLAEPHGMSGPAISSHLKVLEEAGLIDRTVEAQHRRVSLRVEELVEVETWIAELKTFWGRSFDRLENRLTGADPVVDRASESSTESGGRDNE